MDAAYYNQTNILNGSIVHSGDNHDGVGDGDDEQIKIDLSKLPQKTKSLWFIVNAFSGGTFTGVETARFTLYDGSDHNQILYSYGIGMAFDSTALLLGVLSVNDPYSDNKQWSFKVYYMLFADCTSLYEYSYIQLQKNQFLRVILIHCLCLYIDD